MNAHREPRPPFVFTGNYSKEFLEKMGYKPYIPPVIDNVIDGPVMPLEPIKLAYELKINEDKKP